ncbi:hypothetical protein [Mesorhizobium sp. B2-3-4]|nr:hypothetical protein [Mesorhizobium sp. B2-3-4]
MSAAIELVQQGVPIKGAQDAHRFDDGVQVDVLHGDHVARFAV